MDGFGRRNARGSGSRVLFLHPLPGRVTFEVPHDRPARAGAHREHHGYRDPPAAIPCRIGWVEHLVGQQLGLDVKAVRRLVWRNLRTIFSRTDTLGLLPEPMATIMTAAP